MYPSSYPSSSVGGWLAQGGSGFGSFEYGTFKENVISARVALPTGEVKEFSGTELMHLVADAEGITGIITEVEFRVGLLRTRFTGLSRSTPPRHWARRFRAYPLRRFRFGRSRS